MTGQGQSIRIGQQGGAEIHPRILFVTNDTLPQAPWDGMLVYNEDVSEFQIYSVSEGGWLDPFTGQFGNQTYVGDDAPTGPDVRYGDLWIKTPDNVLYRWDGDSWEGYSDPRIVSKNQTFMDFDANVPTAQAIGDLWVVVDMGNLMRRWDGVQWVDLHPAADILTGVLPDEILSGKVVLTNDVYAKDGLLIADGSGASVRVTATGGYHQVDSAGVERVNFPVDPSPDASFKLDGNLTVRGMTSMGYSSFRGSFNEISRDSTMTLAKGTTPPTTTVTSNSGVWVNAAPLPAMTDLTSGKMAGPYWDSTTSEWVFFALGTTSTAKPRIARVDSSGTVTYSTVTAIAGGTAANNSVLAVRSISKDSGGFVFLYDRAKPNTVNPFGQDYDIILVRTNTAMTSVNSTLTIASGNTFSNNPYSRMTSYSNMIWYTEKSSVDPNLTQIRGINYSLGTTAGPVQLASQEMGTFLAGNFDFGSFRFVFPTSGFFSSNVKVLDSTGTIQPTESFTITAADAYYPTIRAIGWDGTSFYAWYDDISGTAAAPVKSSTRTTAQTLRAAFTWYDNDAGGTGKHETTIGPTAAITLPARAGAITFTVPPPADDGTNDSPDSARLYIGLSDATLKLQGSPFVNSITIVDPDPLVGAAPPSSNGFPDGVAARIQSASGATYLSGDGTAVLATGQVGPATFTPTAFAANAKITNLTDPTSDQDAATKSYVDSMMPLGSFMLYSVNTPPYGIWLVADGSAISRATYSDLYTMIGTLYGSGNGTTTFNIPDLRGRFPVGHDPSDVNMQNVGQTGGEKTHTLTVAEMPSHNHGGATGANGLVTTGASSAVGSNQTYSAMGGGVASAVVGDLHTHSIGAQGGGAAHNTLPPFLALTWMFRVKW